MKRTVEPDDVLKGKEKFFNGNLESFPNGNGNIFVKDPVIRHDTMASDSLV